jgi:hypothetical protein
MYESSLFSAVLARATSSPRVPDHLRTDTIIDDVTVDDPTYPTLIVIGTDLPTPEKNPDNDMAEYRGTRPSGNDVVVYRPNIWEKDHGSSDLTMAFANGGFLEDRITIDESDIERFVPVHPL